MLRRFFRLGRSHLISVAALIGALFGAAEAIEIELRGLMHRNSGGVVPLLWSSSVSHPGQENALQIAFLLLIEVAANMLVFAALFALPVALVVGIRRIIKGKNESPPDRAEASAAETREGE
jgi:hypothetical protein